MIAAVSPSPLKGEVDIIISKSFAHRLMIAAALADRETEIIGRSDAKDLLATARCLKALGATVTDTSSGYLIKPAVKSGDAIFDCGESGSTLRFMLPVAAALGREGVFLGEGRLKDRPIGELTSALVAHGIKVTGERLPLSVSGRLAAGEYRIRGDISSQYITGLLFALPLLNGDSEIIIEGKTVSKGYIDITLEVLKQFGIAVIVTPEGFLIKGGQKYISPGRAEVEGDWSNAAFWLAAGAMGGDIAVRGLNPRSVQGDRAIVEILRAAGAEITCENGLIRAKGKLLSGITLDAGEIPDLVPIISAVLSKSDGESVISGIERLKLKESDRIAAVRHILSQMSIRNEYDNSLKICGGKPAGGKIDGHNDHRIVMAAAIAGAYASGTTTISGAEAVNKSYPDFFTVFAALGGKVTCY